MSATVDVAELKLAIPGAQDIEIDQHAYQVSRFFLHRDITKLTNVLELTARLIVTMHHESVTKILSMESRKGSSVITFLCSALQSHRSEPCRTC